MHLQEEEGSVVSSRNAATNTEDRKQWQKPEVKDFTIGQVTNNGSGLGCDGTSSS